MAQYELSVSKVGDLISGVAKDTTTRPERLGFNPRLNHTKDLKKMVLDAALLNTQHYKVWIKGKVE